MSRPTTPIELAIAELETAEATILTFYRDMSASVEDPDEDEGANMIAAFTAISRSVHRAAAILTVAAVMAEEEDHPMIHIEPPGS